MKEKSMIIRKAVQEDAEQIAKIHVDSWRETYKGILKDAYLEDLSYEDRESLWKKAIPQTTVYVAENDKKALVGFASCGKERSGDYADFTGELYTIYLLKKEHGKGIGKKLFQQCICELKQNGIYSMVAFVLADNPARTFYERFGGIELEQLTIEIGGEKLLEIAYGFRF